jgi:hypothetical protein
MRMVVEMNSGRRFRYSPKSCSETVSMWMAKDWTLVDGCTHVAGIELDQGWTQVEEI